MLSVVYRKSAEKSRKLMNVCTVSLTGGYKCWYSMTLSCHVMVKAQGMNILSSTYTVDSQYTDTVHAKDKCRCRNISMLNIIVPGITSAHGIWVIIHKWFSTCFHWIIFCILLAHKLLDVLKTELTILKYIQFKYKHTKCIASEMKAFFFFSCDWTT